jgi:hypothetical protein
VIGQWIEADEECAKLPLVWQILLHLLSERGEATDMAVNLTAVVAIKQCVDVSYPVLLADISYGSWISTTFCLIYNKPRRSCE